jgi:hypothetical protein
MAYRQRVGKDAGLDNQGLGSDHLGSVCAGNRFRSQSND